MGNTVLTKTKWGIDPAHSLIGFKVKHLMIANEEVHSKNLGQVFTQQAKIL